jgi:guanylate kinase
MEKKEGDAVFIVVTAPSGAGKTSLCKEVLKETTALRFCVSHTTRSPRHGEVEGQDYYFIGEEEFRRRIEDGDFIEWVELFGHLYGTSAKAIADLRSNGYDLIADVDPRGAKVLRKTYEDGVFVFILPPSLSELEVRLRRRNAEDDDAVQGRLAKAREEIREACWYDYVIFNDDLSQAAETLRAIYLAEKSRRFRHHRRIDDLIGT